MSIHRKRERMLREAAAIINGKIRKRIIARGEDVLNITQHKIYVNRLLVYSDLPLQPAVDTAMRTPNGFKIATGETLEVLAKICGLSVWEFSKEYSPAGVIPKAA